MIELLLQYGLFLAKSATVVIALLICLAAIFGAVKNWLKVGFDVHVVEQA